MKYHVFLKYNIAIILSFSLLLSGCFSSKPVVITKPKPGTGTDKPTTGNGKPTTGNDKPANTAFKSSYNIGLLLPFYSDKNSDTSAFYAKSTFAMDYYAGAKLAFEAVQNDGIKLNINVLDSKDTRSDFAALLQKNTNADVIIGPAEKDNINAAVKFSNDKNIPIISPYFPSGQLDSDCKLFLQINPSLQAHCEGIMKHALSKYKSNQMVLLCRGKDNEQERFKFFQDANKLAGNNTKLAEVISNDETFALSNTALETYIKPGQTTVFLVPSWNEKFIAALVQKLDKLRKKDNIIIYGMPQWMEFETIEFELLENLNVHVSASQFVDRNDDAAAAFNRLFYNRYGKAANKDAYNGYDTALFVAKMLKKYGSNWINYMDSENYNGLQSSFSFDPVATKNGTGDDNFGKRNKLENKKVFILKYENFAYSLSY